MIYIACDEQELIHIWRKKGGDGEKYLVLATDKDIKIKSVLHIINDYSNI